MVLVVLAWSSAERLPDGLVDARSYVDIKGRPVGAYRLVVDDAAYVEFIGHRESTVLVPASGPPAFVFDPRGALVDWTADSGDDPGFLDQWHAGTRSEMSGSDLEAWLAGLDG